MKKVVSRTVQYTLQYKLKNLSLWNSRVARPSEEDAMSDFRFIIGYRASYSEPGKYEFRIKKRVVIKEVLVTDLVNV